MSLKPALNRVRFRFAMASRSAAVRPGWPIPGRFSPRRLPELNRPLSSSSREGQKDTTAKGLQRSALRPGPSSTHDWIGPPNPLSNLRPIVYRIPENETELEKRLRHLRQDTEDWNQDFWANQNVTFSKEKEAFIVSHLQAKGLGLRDEQGRRRSLNSTEMAAFYKSFLDNNRTRHANYNREWYRRNFSITLLMARVALSSVWRRVTDRSSGRRSGAPPG